MPISQELDAMFLLASRVSRIELTHQFPNLLFFVVLSVMKPCWTPPSSILHDPSPNCLETRLDPRSRPVLGGRQGRPRRSLDRGTSDDYRPLRESKGQPPRRQHQSRPPARGRRPSRPPAPPRLVSDRRCRGVGSAPPLQRSPTDFKATETF